MISWARGSVVMASLAAVWWLDGDSAAWAVVGASGGTAWPSLVLAQLAPGTGELAAYQGLHAAAARDDVAEIERLAASGADLNARDGHGRTPLMVAAHQGARAAAAALIAAGADLNALDHDRYDTLYLSGCWHIQCLQQR